MKSNKPRRTDKITIYCGSELISEFNYIFDMLKKKREIAKQKENNASNGSRNKQDLTGIVTLTHNPLAMFNIRRNVSTPNKKK